MCGRFLLESDIDDIIASYEYVENLNIPSKTAGGEIFPNDLVPIITQNSKLEILKWGFPFKNSSKSVINARSESIAEKPLFRKSLDNRRCVIPANSFFEWKNENNNKIKYRISLTGSSMFSLAGIYDTFLDSCGNEYNAFVIITTDANAEMSLIHPRMPVIFDKGYEKDWLRNNIAAGDLLKILKPYKNDGLLITPDDGLVQMSML